ncbi:LacI family DNA-binding transcriptional regulator [Georgenia muralis]|uniref:LacI family transcriptional regulator n=1 Tax=Georgenia muralis TaxID=154117 RepID=A0A3N4Z301_9MICO|nr:LacI family DNA-binding transcriptional regulator [Georgenia muralis]RPF26214.1 LacI family transcriptional regulator [Georgenia muralis]
MRVTARDVAERAGVSVSTVSRALSTPTTVSPGARRKVESAARELGYEPNPTARGLVTGRTHAMGLVVPDLENPFFAATTKAVQARAWSMGYALVVADSDEDPNHERRLARKVSQQVDGLILCSPRSSDAELEALAGRVPVVLLHRGSGELSHVVADNVEGVRIALRHLRALGHRHIAYAGGPHRSWSDGQRREGLTRAADTFGDITIEDLGSFQPFFSGGVAAADLVLASDATAVLVYNDLMALGLLSRAGERGVDVPGGLSVASFDDIPLAGGVGVPLTTVAIPIGPLARAAVDVLAHLIEDGAPARAADSPLGHRLPVELMVRETTGPVPSPTVPIR